MSRSAATRQLAADGRRPSIGHNIVINNLLMCVIKIKYDDL